MNTPPPPFPWNVPAAFWRFGVTLGQIGSTSINALRTFFSNGTSVAPSVSFQGSQFDGFYWAGLGLMLWTSQASPSVAFNSGVVIRTDGSLQWAPNGNLQGSIQGNIIDLGIKRGGDGYVQITRADLGARGTVMIGDPGYARPAAAVGLRGLIWIEFKGAGVADTVAICVKNAADAYVWQTLI